MKIKKNTNVALQFPGAMALAAAGAATQANAATVQISFANNMLSLSSGYTNFVPDLTGDGIADVFGVVSSRMAGVFRNLSQGSYVPLMVATNGSTFNVLDPNAGWQPDYVRTLVAVTFSDARINNSAVTSGFLDLEGHGSRYHGDVSVQIRRLIFNDNSTAAPTGITSATTGLSEWGATSPVPEASTSLGLLALGAGGLLTRRRQKRAA